MPTGYKDATHAFLCEALGIEPFWPRPDWLPYAVQATIVHVTTPHDGRIRKWGGGMRCGSCGFGVDIRPGPNSGTQHPEPEALRRCPKCGWDGVGASAPSPEERANG